MASIGIIYHSGTGYTALAADAVRRGVESTGAAAHVFEIDPADIVEGRWSNESVLASLDSCDGIVFGSPTYMGGVSAQTKAFFDATLDRYVSRAWKDKIGAGFTVSSTPSGDKLHALVTMTTYAMQMAMIWVGVDQLPMNDQGLNRLSVYFGAAAQADYTVEGPAIDERDEATAEALGARVADIASRVSG